MPSHVPEQGRGREKNASFIIFVLGCRQVITLWQRQAADLTSFFWTASLNDHCPAPTLTILCKALGTTIGKSFHCKYISEVFIVKKVQVTLGWLKKRKHRESNSPAVWGKIARRQSAPGQGQQEVLLHQKVHQFALNKDGWCGNVYPALFKAVLL